MTILPHSQDSPQDEESWLKFSQFMNPAEEEETDCSYSSIRGDHWYVSGLIQTLRSKKCIHVTPPAPQNLSSESHLAPVLFQVNIRVSNKFIQRYSFQLLLY